jgi:predicted Zn-dependent protease
MPGMPGMGYSNPGNAWIFIAGVSAVKLGDAQTASAAEARLRGLREKLAADGNAYGAKEMSILEKEVAALARMAAGQKEEALKLAKEAVDVELTLSPPSGPPDPMKPALELYGEMLLETNRFDEAANAFSQSLLRTPKRTPSLLGLARASARSGNTTAARQHYTEIATMPGAVPGSPAMQEAEKFLKAPVTDAARR